jgi:hypothetical protein
VGQDWLRLYGSEVRPGEKASLFAFKQRFIEETYEEQFYRAQARYEEKLERYKPAA